MCGETVKHKHGRVHPILKDDTFQTDGDMYFTCEDIDTGEPRMCFKRLMRHISFPPDYELLKIDWYDNQDIQIRSNRGIAPTPSDDILTFEIQGIVPLWGEGHNLYPQ